MIAPGGADLIFQGRDLSAYTLKHARSYGEEFDTTYTCTDPDALLTYLAELPMETITGSYSFSDPERELTLIFSAPEGTLGVTLSDHSIRLTPLYGDRGSSTYYLPTGADWDHLDSLLLPFPALHIRLKGPDDIYGTTFSASLISLTLTEGKTVTVLQEPPDPREAVSGSFGHYASEPCTVALTFSLPPLPGGTLEIESWDGSSSRTLSLSELEDPICFTTAAAPAHYNIHASFAGPGDAIYDAVFRFDIGDMDN